MVPIKQLLAKPFGPYEDSQILSSSWVPKGKNLPQLSRVQLRQNDKSIIGLDLSERYLDAPETPSGPVFFFGILVIDKLEWLSEVGRAVLQKELNEREVLTGHRSSQNSQRAIQAQLSLNGLYEGNGFKISVTIYCQKDSAAMYMTDKYYPHSLVLNSKNQRRSWEIISLERSTYFLSSNFLERYRLAALIADITEKYKEQYKDGPKARIDMLVKEYLSKHKEEGWSHVVIFAEGGAIPEPPLLRHISQAEVREVFAAHSGWLLAFYLLKSGPCSLDVREWCGFIREVRRAKRSRKVGAWARTHEDDEIWASDRDDESDDASLAKSIAKSLAKFGGNPLKWEKLLLNAMNIRTGVTSRAIDYDIQLVRSKHRLIHDPDFSEPSTPGCSDAEYDSDSCEVDPPPIPPHMREPPSLLPGRFIWDCPVPQCRHSIDFLKPDNIPGNGLSETYVRNQQFCNLQDEHVQRVLCRMVEQHYLEHIRIGSTNIQNPKHAQILSKLWQERAK
ncbi:hypothetical protein C8R46DRAFT_1084870 [Mycena filopes]|nr:hypothetical protein C8R46DRAFT_1084870 [Mycena filopes]